MAEAERLPAIVLCTDKAGTLEDVSRLVFEGLLEVVTRSAVPPRAR